MNKYSEPHEGTIDLVNQVLDNSFLATTDIKIKVLVDNKLTKKPVKVVKANDLVKYETGNHVYVFVNEIILDELYNVDNKFPLITIEEALASISYDLQKGNVTIEPKEIETYIKVLEKHGLETYVIVEESIKTLYQVEKDKNKK